MLRRRILVWREEPQADRAAVAVVNHLVSISFTIYPVFRQYGGDTAFPQTFGAAGSATIGAGDKDKPMRCRDFQAKAPSRASEKAARERLPSAGEDEQ